MGRSEAADIKIAVRMIHNRKNTDMRPKFLNALINRILLLTATVISLGIQLFVLSGEQVHEVVTKLVILILGVLAFIISMSSNKVRRGSEYKFAIRYSLFTVVITTLFILYTKNNYGYTFYQALVAGVPNYYIVFSVPIAQILSSNRDKKFITDFLLKIIIFFVLIRTLSWIIYNFSGSSLLRNFATEYDGWIRGGRIRLIGGSLFGIAYILLVDKAISNRSRGYIRINRYKTINMYTVLVLFMILYTVFVSATRYAAAAMIVTYVIALYFSRRDDYSKFAILGILLFSFVMLFLGGFASSFIRSFSTQGTLGASTLARVDGLTHFWKLFLSVGNGFGLGFVLDGNTTEDLFYRTSWLRYYLGDLGIIGSFFRFGIFIIPLYLWPFFKTIKVCVTSKKRRSNNTGLMIALTCYMILISLGSNLYEPNIAFAVPFYIAMISVEDGNNKNAKVNNIRQMR